MDIGRLNNFKNSFIENSSGFTTCCSWLKLKSNLQMEIVKDACEILDKFSETLSQCESKEEFKSLIKVKKLKNYLDEDEEEDADE